MLEWHEAGAAPQLCRCVRYAHVGLSEQVAHAYKVYGCRLDREESDARLTFADEDRESCDDHKGKQRHHGWKSPPHGCTERGRGTQVRHTGAEWQMQGGHGEAPSEQMQGGRGEAPSEQCFDTKYLTAPGLLVAGWLKQATRP